MGAAGEAVDGHMLALDEPWALDGGVRDPDQGPLADRLGVQVLVTRLPQVQGAMADLVNDTAAPAPAGSAADQWLPCREHAQQPLQTGCGCVIPAEECLKPAARRQHLLHAQRVGLCGGSCAADRG